MISDSFLRNVVFQCVKGRVVGGPCPVVLWLAGEKGSGVRVLHLLSPILSYHRSIRRKS
jgi:hypothetical protein